MDRLACLDVEPLRLQWLALQNPEWATGPLAVISTGGPEGSVLELNAEAAKEGIQLGMRYASALALSPGLRAEPVSDEEVTEQQRRLIAVAHRFSPDVESYERGTLLIRASGLERMTPSLYHWAARLEGAVKRHMGLASRIGIGFSRLGALVAARVRGGRYSTYPSLVFETQAQESREVARAPLHSFAALPPKVAAQLRRLAVGDVASLLALPGDGILRRFGPELHRLHRLASGAIHAPLSPEAHEVSLITTLDLEPPERNSTRLLFRIKGTLGPLLVASRAKHHVVRELLLTLSGERGNVLKERIGAAIPTLDERAWSELIRLRLEHTPIDAGVGSMTLELVTVRARPGQLMLLPSRNKRSIEDADQGLARVRAEFGPNSVVTADLLPVNVPEQQVLWAPLEALPPEAVDPQKAFPIGPAPPICPVRRLNKYPDTVSDRPTGMGPPTLLSWGWWCDEESDTKSKGLGWLDRQYRYAHFEDGTVVWLVAGHDGRRWGRWRVAATIE